MEVRQDEDSEEHVSCIRLVTEDANVTLPKVLETLNGANVRSVEVLKPSFDEVFFRLVGKSDS